MTLSVNTVLNGVVGKPLSKNAYKRMRNCRSRLLEAWVSRLMVPSACETESEGDGNAPSSNKRRRRRRGKRGGSRRGTAPSQRRSGGSKKPRKEVPKGPSLYIAFGKIARRRTWLKLQARVKTLPKPRWARGAKALTFQGQIDHLARVRKLCVCQQFKELKTPVAGTRYPLIQLPDLHRTDFEADDVVIREAHRPRGFVAVKREVRKPASSASPSPCPSLVASGVVCHRYARCQPCTEATNLGSDALRKYRDSAKKTGTGGIRRSQPDKAPGPVTCMQCRLNGTENCRRHGTPVEFINKHTGKPTVGYRSGNPAPKRR
jgi:hypothetical protein